MPHTRAFPGLLTLFVGVAISCSSQTQPSNPDSALQTILVQLEGAPLGLQKAIKYSTDTAPSVLAARAAYDAAQGAVRHEAGAFDPELSLSWDYLEQKQPAASFFAGATVLRTIQGTGTAGLRWNLPIGTSLEASLGAVRLNSNSSFAFLSPQYTTIGTLTLRQPLLHGFHLSARKDLTSAEQQEESAHARYEQEVLALSTEIELLYWDLYAGERNFAVQKLTRDRAAAFLKDTELRAKAGLIGPNQVANARTFLAEQEILLLDREEQLDHFSDQLTAAIGVRPEKPQPRFKTQDQPRDVFPIVESDALVLKAVEANLELRAAKAEIESRRTQSRAASWEALPSVDLIGSLGGNGLAGTAQDVIFGTDTLRTTTGGQFGDAVRQAVNRDFPLWRVGLEVNVPIGFRSGLGERDRLEAEVTIAEQRYAQAERMLEAEVRLRSRELMHGQHRLQAAREGVAAAQEQVRIGLIEFQNGRSTAFELVRLGEDFAVAQQRYSEALVRSAKAAALLRQLSSGAYATDVPATNP